MMLFYLLLSQVAVLGTETALADVKFDLRNVPPATASPQEIVVTGRRKPDPRIRPLPETSQGSPRAEIGLVGDTRVGIEVEQSGLAGGAVSNRAMVRVKVRF